ncbi:MAG TPA: hypothetical protein PLN31_05520 [Azoarcus taiwanensis]|nr:hypothetical protein [Azoarcus taiwanensis]
MSRDLLEVERTYLANLLEAIQRCAYFLHESEQKLEWPLVGEYLAANKKNVALFETLAALNERFARLQDTLAAAMRHSALLMSEPTDSFLKILALFEKLGVIESTADWQRSRAARNLAAHDYETDYAAIAEHFNMLCSLHPMLYTAAGRLVAVCRDSLKVEPLTRDFHDEFERIVGKYA